MNNKILIIAEAGVNHNGQIEMANKLIDVAKDSNSDIVKFQTFKSNMAVSRFAKKAEYQKLTTSNEESQLEMVKKLELSEEQHKILIKHCIDKNISFLSTPFDMASIDFLKSLGQNKWKIPSGEITNFPYLKKIGAFGQEVILSTGMSNLGEIEAALNILIGSGTNQENITILHCSTEYPAPYDEVNLNAMLTIRDAFKVKVGYSDHTPGIEVSIAAAAMGAAIIEKHFTLDKNLPGPDHKASLEPSELKNMVAAIRNIETALGDGVKKCMPSELKNRAIARKSIVAAKTITAGEIFTEDNITVKRPGDGINPMEWDKIIGRQSIKNFEEDEQIVI